MKADKTLLCHRTAGAAFMKVLRTSYLSFRKQLLTLLFQLLTPMWNIFISSLHELRLFILLCAFDVQGVSHITLAERTV